MSEIIRIKYQSLKMNAQTIVTITFGDQAENHAGMEKLGMLVEKGEGFNLEDLKYIKQRMEEIGSRCELIKLELLDKDEIVDVGEDGYILIIIVN